ncbi:MAG: hypothetical protein ACTTIC_07370 [Helicobacteraceae bacterium]
MIQEILAGARWIFGVRSLSGLDLDATCAGSGDAKILASVSGGSLAGLDLGLDLTACGLDLDGR